MTLFRTTLRQAIGGSTYPDAYKWSNVWYIEAASANAAANRMVDIWTGTLRETCQVGVYAYEVYASDLVPSTTNFDTVAIDPGDQRGTNADATGDGQDLYTPSMCLRVDLYVPSGYASRKWVRVGLNEAAVAAGGNALSNVAWGNTVIDQYALVSAMSDVRDESGNEFSGAVLVGLRSHRLGKFARFELPTPPAFG